MNNNLSNRIVEIKNDTHSYPKTFFILFTPTKTVKDHKSYEGNNYNRS